MSFNGSGVFTINTAGQPVITGTTISSTTFNSLTADLATGLTTALTKDGQSTPTANIGMGAFKITNLAAGTVASDAARLDQVQGGAATFISVTGTDTLTGTVVPALSAYATGNQFSFVVANTNTGAVTINLDGIGSKAITRTGTTALVAGDMVAGQAVEIIYDGTRFQLVNGNSFTNLKVSGTLGVTGVATFTAQPIASSLTASLPVFTDASKGLVSNTMTGTGNVVMSTSPTLVTPALGTPSALVGTNITGTATNFTASNVTTNANLTGPITSVGNATSIASQTGTGTTFAMSASPTFTGTVGAAALTTTGNTILGNASTDTLNVGNGGLVKDASSNLIITNPTSQSLTTANYNLQLATSSAYVIDTGPTFGLYAAVPAISQWPIAIISARADGTSYGGYLQFTTTPSTGTPVERMRISSSGNVGIGTATPAGKLDITGANVVVKATASSGYAGFYANGATGSTAYNFFAINGTETARISSDAGNFLAFATGSSPTERMRIDSSGDVGIGTVSPTTRLTVVSATTNAGIAVNDGTVNTIIYNSTGGVSSIGTTTNHPVDFYSNNAARMRIDSSGNVGIGTASPNDTLDVAGNIRISSASLLRWVDAGTVRSSIQGDASSNLIISTASTERMRISSTGNTYVETGNLWQYSPAPTALAAGANAGTAAQLRSGMFSAAQTTAVTLTMPTGTAIDTGFAGIPAVTDIGFYFYVINTGSALGAVTVAVNTDVTSLGSLVVAVGTSAQFRLRRTLANTYVMYRLS